jgi:hypothetical protein
MIARGKALSASAEYPAGFKKQKRRARRIEWKFFKKRWRMEKKRGGDISLEDAVNKHLLLIRHCGPGFLGEEFYDFAMGEGSTQHNVFAVKVNLRKALQGPGCERWRKAVDKELNAFREKGVFEPVKHVPAGHTIIPLVCLGELKDGGTRAKCRCIALGNRENASNDDYSSYFAPVVSTTTLRSVLTWSLNHRTSCRGFDIGEAFLYGDLASPVYVKPPPEFGQTGYWKLKKAVYGLKCAPLCWNKKFDEEARRQGWKKSSIDQCLYTKDGMKMLVYVDDCLLFGEDSAIVREREKLMAVFPGRICDPVDGVLDFLGMEITFKDDQVRMCNPSQVEKLLAEYPEVMPRKTPMPTSIPSDDFSSAELSETTGIGANQYRHVVGVLNYLSCSTRPDLSYVVNFLSRKLESPDDHRLKVAKQAVGYLLATRNRELILNRSKNFDASNPSCIVKDVACFSDADFHPVRSTSGNVITIAGTPILWTSRTQKLCTLSTAESEYIALASCVKEVTYLSALLAEIYQYELDASEDAQCFEINVLPPDPYAVWVDNKSAICMANSSSPTNRTKHLRVRFNYIARAVEEKLIRIAYIPSCLNLADMLTKPLSRAKLDLFFAKEYIEAMENAVARELKRKEKEKTQTGKAKGTTKT